MNFRRPNLSEASGPRPTARWNMTRWSTRTRNSSKKYQVPNCKLELIQLETRFMPGEMIGMASFAWLSAESLLYQHLNWGQKSDQPILVQDSAASRKPSPSELSVSNRPQLLISSALVNARSHSSEVTSNDNRSQSFDSGELATSSSASVAAFNQMPEAQTRSSNSFSLNDLQSLSPPVANSTKSISLTSGPQGQEDSAIPLSALAGTSTLAGSGEPINHAESSLPPDLAADSRSPIIKTVLPPDQRPPSGVQVITASSPSTTPASSSSSVTTNSPAPLGGGIDIPITVGVDAHDDVPDPGLGCCASVADSSDLTVNAPTDVSTDQPCACGANPSQDLTYSAESQSPGAGNVIQVTTTITGPVSGLAKLQLDMSWDNGAATSSQVFTAPVDLDPTYPFILGAIAPSSVVTTGRHQYVATVSALRSDNSVIATGSSPSRITYTVNPADVANGTTYGGSGWTLGLTDRLISVAASFGQPGGFLLWAGTGSYRFYADQGNGTFLNSGPDRGQLVTITGGTKWVNIQGVTEVFNSSGYETNWVSADGAKTVTFVYDANNRVQNVKWYDGSNSTYSYNASSNVNQIVTQFPVATNSGLGSTTSGALATYTINYSGSQISSIQEPDGRTRYFTYDGSGRLIESRIGTAASSGLNVDSYRYDGNGLLNQIRHGNFTSDNSGLNIYNVTSQVAQGLTSVWYNQPIVGVVTDPLNRTTSYAFDKRGFQTSQQNPDGGVYTYTRDSTTSDLNSVTIPGPSGPLTTTYTYDFFTGLETNVSYPDGTNEQFTWQSITANNGVYGINRHVLASYTNDIGTQFLYSYDAVGHPSLIQQDPSGVNALYTLTWSVEGVGQTTNPGTTAFGNLLSYTYSKDGVTTNIVTNTYDTRGRLLSTRDPIGTYTYDYDDKGNLGLTKDRRGIPTTYTYDSLHRVVNIRRADPDGGGSLTQWLGTFVYDDAGQLKTTEDPLSATTRRSATYSYDSRGLSTGVSELYFNGTVTTTLRQTTFNYDAASQLSSTVDPNGNTTQYGYDSVGRLNSTTYQAGLGTVTATYFQTGWLSEVTDARGFRTSYAYTATGLLQSSTEEGNPGTSDDRIKSYLYVYDTVNRQLKVGITDSRNNTTTYVLDSLNRLTSLTSADPDGAGSLTSLITTYAYDKVGNLTQITYPRIINGSTHVITTFSYDAVNRLVDQTVAANTTAEKLRTTFSYDAGDRLTGMTEAVNNASLLRTSTYAYDDLNRLTDQTESTNVAATKRQTTFSYDAASRLVDTTFVANSTTLKRETTYAYDALNRMTGMSEAANGGTLKRLTTYGYDKNDNLSSVADVLNRLSTYTYDARNRLTQVTQPDPDGGGPLTSPITQYGYDGNNNVVSVTNARNNITTYSYDQFNELQQITQPSPDGVAPTPLTTFGYDNARNLITVADPNNHLTTYNYDNLNRVISVVGPVPGGGAGSSVTQYNYDQAGTVGQIIESPGLGIQNITTYTYDNLDRVLTDSETVQLTGSTTAAAIHSLAYDTLGRLQSKVDADSRLVTYTYDSLDRLTGEKWYSGPTTGSTLQRTITYAYDLRDNLKDDNEGTANVRSTFTYDLLDRVTDETQVIPQASGSVTFTYRTTFSYFADDQVQSRRALINGTLNHTTSYSYDGIGRLADEKETLNPSGTGNKEAVFTYLPTGQIETIQRKGGSSFTNAALTTYSYDNLERVSGISTIQGANSYQYTYAYDTASRITGETNPSGSVTYTYYDNDQIKTATYSYRSAESFTWDENGNPIGGGVVIGAGDRLINDGTSTYEYDAEGNRTKKSTGTTVSTYSWDQRERLTGMTTKVSGTTNKLVTVTYDAFNRRIAEYAGNGSTVSRRDHYFWDGDQVHTIANGTSSPTVTDRFLMGPGIDNVIDDEKAGTNDWTLTDVRGDVQEVIDSNGNSLTKKDYSTFGVKSDTGNPSVVDTIFAYTGRENDPDLGLQYNRDRWYDAAAKRFVSADYIFDDSNTYRYVRNNPINGSDPSGLEGPGSGNAEAEKALNELGKLELKRIREGLTPFEQQVWRSLRDYARDLLEIPHYEITPPPPEKGVCRQLWDAAKEGVWEGMGNVSDATLQMGEGILNTVLHPIDTIGGLATQFGEGVQMLWNDPLGTLGNAWNNITKDPSKSLAQFGVNVLFMFGSMVGKGGPAVPAAEAKPPFGGTGVATVEGDASLAGTAAFPPPEVMPPGPFNGCQAQMGQGIAPRSIETPHGTALQGLTPEAQALQQSVAAGQPIYRGGNFPKSAGPEGQYWSPQNPLTPGYANSVGAANMGMRPPDFILGGRIRPGGNFITRPAPPFGGNIGGALEVVPESGCVQIDFFCMP